VQWIYVDALDDSVFEEIECVFEAAMARAFLGYRIQSFPADTFALKSKTGRLASSAISGSQRSML
jgi:hypothetical protein